MRRFRGTPSPWNFRILYPREGRCSSIQILRKGVDVVATRPRSPLLLVADLARAALKERGRHIMPSEWTGIDTTTPSGRSRHVEKRKVIAAFRYWAILRHCSLLLFDQMLTTSINNQSPPCPAPLNDRKKEENKIMTRLSQQTQAHSANDGSSRNIQILPDEDSTTGDDTGGV